MQNQGRLLSNLKSKTNKLFKIPLAPLNIQSQTVVAKRPHCMIAPFRKILLVDI